MSHKNKKEQIATIKPNELKSRIDQSQSSTVIHKDKKKYNRKIKHKSKICKDSVYESKLRLLNEIMGILIEDRKKIILTGNENYKELIKKYNIDRSTAFRGLKRGYFYIDYHKKQESEVDNVWFDDNLNNLNKISKGAIKKIIEKYGKELLNVIDYDDLIQEALLKILSLSGHKNRDNNSWLFMVATNAIRGFIQKNYLKHTKKKDSLYQKDGDELKF